MTRTDSFFPFLSLQLCDSPPATDEANGGTIYSAPVAHLGSTTNLAQVPTTSAAAAVPNTLQSSSEHSHLSPEEVNSSQGQSGGGYVTDEEIELHQTLHPTANGTQNGKDPVENMTSPSKEVLIGGDNYPSRRYYYIKSFS